jgi:hypothetical protein
MTLELILAVLGLAASAAQLVPLFSAGTSLKLRIVAVFSVILILGLTTVAVWDGIVFRKKVEALRGNVMKHVTRTVSFEDLLGELYYPEYAVLERAVDGLVSEERLQQRKIWATTDSGEKVTLRVFEPKR